MSGHSKWTQIKRQKGISDQKRGQAFTKMAKAIIIAIQDNGGIGDPEQNFKLRLAVDKARSINMPKENIERAIEKGMGKGGTLEDMFEAVYEGFGPTGVSFIVEAVTDNKLRTTSEVKNIFDKSGGSLGVSGAVSYKFQQKGLITTAKNGKSLDDIFLLAADAGAEDIKDLGEEAFIYTKPGELAKVRDVLRKNGIAIKEAQLIRKPVVTTQITDQQDAQKITALIEKLENLDDVQKVYTNADIL